VRASFRLPVESRPALQIILLMLAADAVVVALHVVNEVGGYYAQMFNLDLEQNLPTWLSSAQFLGVGIAAAALARRTEARERLASLVLAVVFFYFSLDEVALVHEKLAEHVREELEGVPKLPILYAPIGAACAVSLWVLLPVVRRYLGTSLLLLGGFALIGISVLLDAADIQSLDLPSFRPFIIAEESTELSGTALLTFVLLAVALARSGQRQEPEPESVNAPPAAATNRQS
jgi:hypothetical protein